jgi:hypothetical protein
VEHAVERKTRWNCRCRPLGGLALALFALFGGLATAAQAMLLTLDLRWTGSDLTAYNLQEGSIIQVIGFKQGEGASFSPDVASQFGEPYGCMPNDDQTSAAPYTSGHVPDHKDVYLADNTQGGHEILYTGSIQSVGTWYGLYTQITVDNYLYDTVYIRVFGATEIKQGEVTASYWGVSTPQTLSPSYATDTLAVTNLLAGSPNYFEVIPEPATVGLLGLGGVALAAWRRRRAAKADGGESVCEED